MAVTYSAQELAELLGVSSHTIYEQVKRGTCPVMPIRIGHRMVWPKHRVDQLLGQGPEPNKPAVVLPDGLPEITPKVARAVLRVLLKTALEEDD